MKKIKIYLANGLFSEADRLYNDIIYDYLIKEGFEVYAPQKNMGINDKKSSANSIKIYDGDTERLNWCDVALCFLDGQDLGVATEIGYLAGYNQNSKKKKAIVGIYTDCRDASKTMNKAKNKDSKADIAESQYSYINLYTIGAVKKYGKVFDNIKDAIYYIKKLRF